MQTDTSTAQDVRQSTEETASTLVDQAQQVASSQVTTQKDRAASTLDAVAQSLHQTGSGMRDQQPQIASLADPEAERIVSEIEETRSRMGATIDEIGHRLQPQTIADRRALKAA